MVRMHRTFRIVTLGIKDSPQSMSEILPPLQPNDEAIYQRELRATEAAELAGMQAVYGTGINPPNPIKHEKVFPTDWLVGGI